MKKRVSVIILNYNRFEDSVGLIKSLLMQSYKDVEIILVDNASIDKSAEKLQKKFPDVSVVVLPKNIGRAGHNTGAERAKGDVLVFLDADIYFTDKNFLKKLVEKFSRRSIDAIGMYMKDPTGKTYGWEPSYFANGNVQKGYEGTFGGGMWAIRRSIFEEVGGFNPSFFVYVDEWEYLIRLWRKGYSVTYFPDLVGYHKESAYAYRSIMKGYHVIVNHAQIYALYLPVGIWFRFFRHHGGQVAGILQSGEANRWGTIKGLLFALYFFLRVLPKRNAIRGETLDKFLRFYFPKQGDVIVGKWGWKRD